MDIGGPPPAPISNAPAPSATLDLLGGGLDVLVSILLRNWLYASAYFMF